MICTIARTRAFPVPRLHISPPGSPSLLRRHVRLRRRKQHRAAPTMAHVIGLLTFLLIVAVFVGRVPEKRLVFAVLGLLVGQGHARPHGPVVRSSNT